MIVTYSSTLDAISRAEHEIVSNTKITIQGLIFRVDLSSSYYPLPDPVHGTLFKKCKFIIILSYC